MSVEIVGKKPEAQALQTPLPSEQRKPLLCAEEHQWNFNHGSVDAQQGEVLLRSALQHLITTQHKVGEEVLGGYTPDETLQDQLSLRWFRKVGLQQEIALRFEGDITKAIQFAWPEGFPDPAAAKDPEPLISSQTPKHPPVISRVPIESIVEPPKRKTNLADTLDKMEDPEFWKEFLDDVASLDQPLTFSRFLKQFNPNGAPARKGYYYIAGKYRSIHSTLFESDTRYRFLRILGKDFQFGEPPTAKDGQDAFFEAAPPEVKFLLQERFPNTFGVVKREALEEHELVTPQTQFIIEAVSQLREDNRDQILDSVSKYINSKRNQDGIFQFPDAEIKRILEQVLGEYKPEHPRVGLPHMEDLLKGADDYKAILEELSSDNPKIAEAAGELVAKLDQLYYQPMMKSLLYKPASLYWSMYHEEHQAPPHVDLLVKFLESYADEKASIVERTDNEKVVVSHFQEAIIPPLLQQFADIREYAGEASKYFKSNDQNGEYKFLFLHQVEAIKQFVEQRCGILADEPGTGKTMILAPAALDILDKTISTTKRPGRAIVIGSKTVINNWEEELGIHMKDGSVNVFNISDPADEEESLSQASLPERLKKLESFLLRGEGDRQFVLVNYDIFRNPNFQRLLAEHQFDVSIIDEAHNIKSRFIESLTDELSDPNRNKRVAQRTSGLYGFLRNSPNIATFWATSTPYVKENIESLIMVHLTAPDLLPIDLIEAYMNDPVKTNDALKNVMIRRKKEEIADLPPKETVFVPIDLSSMSEDAKINFLAVASELEGKTPHDATRFYSLLSLEGQAKFPWLQEKVKEILEKGHKVVIFTPFVHEDRYTSAISTKAIARRLNQLGIDSVGVLDGSLADRQRQAVKADFHKKNGKKVLVGNFETAGESITLNSPENHATEVIIFMSPDTTPQYLQAIDRIHRLGQDEKVTIHIPYVTNDILGRSRGTFDERTIQRLRKELGEFAGVVDGLFFIEPEDIYNYVVQEEASLIKLPLRFDSKAAKPRKKRRAADTIDSEQEMQADEEVVFIDLSEEDFKTDTVTFDHTVEKDIPESQQDLDILGIFMRQMRQYPIFDSLQQEKLAIRFYKEGKTVRDLAENQEFLATISPKLEDKFKAVFTDSQSIKELILNCNLPLVVSIAARYRGKGLSFEDLIQEGSTGLMKALERFDNTKDFKFSTYATWWIRQAVTRAIADQARLIRVPVHMYEKLGKVYGIANEFEVKNGRSPTKDELEILLKNSGIESTDAVLDTYLSGIAHPTSLNLKVGPNKDREFGEFLYDTSTRLDDAVEDQLEMDSLRAAIRRSMQENLTPTERKILSGRAGLDSGEKQTLEDIGAELGVSRERIRQIEARATKKLRNDRRLQEAWEARLLPGYAYKLSAEQAALQMGLLDIEPDNQGGVKPMSREKAKRAYRKASAEERYEREQKDVDRVKIQSELWDSLSPQEKSILSIYYRQGTNPEVAKERLATILELSQEALSSEIHGAIQHVRQLLRPARTQERKDVVLYKKPRERRISPRRQKELKVLDLRKQGYSREQIAETLKMRKGSVANAIDHLLASGELQARSLDLLSEIVETVVQNNPAISNKVLAREVGKELDRFISPEQVKAVATQLQREGRIERRRETSAQVKAFDARVEEAIQSNSNRSIEEIARALEEPFNRVMNSAYRLAHDGKLDQKDIEQATRKALVEYIESHPGEINLSDFARSVGTSRQWASQLYDKMYRTH